MRITPLSKDEKLNLSTMLNELELLPRAGKVEIHVDGQGKVAVVKVEMTLK